MHDTILYMYIEKIHCALNYFIQRKIEYFELNQKFSQ